MDRSLGMIKIMGPNPEPAQLHVVFGLAGNRTGVTTNAANLIDDHADPLPRFGEMRTKVFPRERS